MRSSECEIRNAKFGMWNENVGNGFIRSANL